MLTPTPGPWRFVSDVGAHVIRQQRSDGEFEGYIASTWGGEHIGNARLIAAAPELLEALMAMYDEFNSGDINSGEAGVLIKAAAAILKATRRDA